MASGKGKKIIDGLWLHRIYLWMNMQKFVWNMLLELIHVITVNDQIGVVYYDYIKKVEHWGFMLPVIMMDHFEIVGQ